MTISRQHESFLFDDPDLDLSQGFLLNQLAKFLEIAHTIPEPGKDLEPKRNKATIETMKDMAKKGACHSFTIKIAYAIYLTQHVPITGDSKSIPRDDWPTLKKMLTTLSKWDGDPSKLTVEDKKDFDRLVDFIMFYQKNTEELLNINFGEIGRAFEDTKGRKMENMYSLTGMFIKSDLAPIPTFFSSRGLNVGQRGGTGVLTAPPPSGILKELDTDYPVMITGYKTHLENTDEFFFHALFMFKDGETRYFYDPNHKQFFRDYNPDNKNNSKNLSGMSNDIFLALETKATRETPVMMNFTVVDFANPKISKEPQSGNVFPSQKDLLFKTRIIDKKISLDTWQKDNKLLIHLCSELGDIESLQYYFANGNNMKLTLDMPDKEGNTGLMLAIEHNHPEIAIFLLKAGANVELENKLKSTALHRAAVKGNLELAELLLSKGADINAVDKNLMTPLDYAVKYGHMDLIDILIKKYNANLGFIGYIKDHPNPNIVEFLASEFNMPVLKFALQHKLFNATEKIVNGKDFHVDLNTEEGKAIFNDVMQSDVYHQYLFLQHAFKTKNTAFFNALLGNQNIESLMAQQMEQHQISFFHMAAENGDFEILQTLLNATDKPLQKEMVNLRDEDLKSTPLHRAAKRGHGEIIDYLIANGAKIDEPDIDDQTPLMRAIRGGHPGVIQTLIDHGARTNPMSIDSNDPAPPETLPIHIAAMQANPEVMQLLITATKNINVPNPDGMNALHLAVQSGHLPVIEILLQAKADVTARDDAGKTPLDYAKEKIDELKEAKEDTSHYEKILDTLLHPENIVTKSKTETVSQDTSVKDTNVSVSKLKNQYQQKVTEHTQSPTSIPRKVDKLHPDRLRFFESTKPKEPTGVGDETKISPKKPQRT